MYTVILAGGASRRMGQDKAMLPFGNTTLLQYLIDKYQFLGPVAVSLDSPGRYPFHGAIELLDRYPSCGPLNGIVSAFAETDAEELFLTAVDLPFGSPALAGKLAALRGSADICIMQRGVKGVEPLFAVYGRPCGTVAQDCLAAGEKSVFDLLKKLTVRCVQPEELPEFDLERILTNVNTPDDYRALLKNEPDEHPM